MPYLEKLLSDLSPVQKGIETEHIGSACTGCGSDLSPVQKGIETLGVDDGIRGDGQT